MENQGADSFAKDLALPVETILATLLESYPMPITGTWRSLRSESAPEAPGVYELGDFNGSVLYIGSSGNLKRSIARHANGQETDPAGRAMWFRYEQTAAFDTRVRELLWQYERSNRAPPPRNAEDSPA